MIRVKATITGSLPEQADDMGRKMARAVAIAVAGAAEGAKQDLRGQLAGANFSRFRRAIQGATYPKPPRYSMKAAGTVFAAGDSAERAFSAFSEGAVVLPNKAKALAIPLHHFRGVDRKLLGPRSSFFAGRLKFIPSRMRSTATMVGILALPDESAGKRRGRGRGTDSRRRAEIADTLVGRWKPMFILVRAVRLPKLLSPEQTMERWAGQLPALTEQALLLMRD